MSILFVGGEDIDFQLPIGSWRFVVDRYRFDYSRGSLRLAPGRITHTAVAYGGLSSPTSSFWLSAQIALTPGRAQAGGGDFIMLLDKSTFRLAVRHMRDATFQVVSYADDGTATVLASSTATLGSDSPAKYDVQIGPNAFNLFFNGDPIIAYSGAVPLGSSAAIDRVAFQSPDGDDGYPVFVSEVVVATNDTRLLSVKTHVPTAAGSASDWTGTYDKVNDETADGRGIISTNAVDARSTFGVNRMPSGSFSVYGVKVSARVARGESGPSRAALLVKGGAAIAEGASQPVDTGWTKITQVWETNPSTSTAWTTDDINAVEIGIKSKT